MRPPFQAKQRVVINAPLKVVWDFNMDLARIPEFHPRVFKVDLLSGKRYREAGAAYQCHVVGGKHLCTEQDIEIVPMEKIVTILPEDTFGISKILPDYRVETTFQKIDEHTTAVTIEHYYATASLKGKLFNLLGKRRIARETEATLRSIKNQIEREAPAAVAFSRSQNAEH
jgi:uncharacterized membrane protein